jgi:hypothetical protein
MLIIASPKSASSSLAETLSKSTGLHVRNAVVRRDVLRHSPAACDFPVLGRLHQGDIQELSASQIEAISALPGIKKHHLPPTPNNLTQLSTTSKVILLRPAEEIIDAYWRGFQTGVWPIEHEAFRNAGDIQSWRSIARQIGLTRELQQFNQGWLDYTGERLLISYQELLADSETVIRLILNYFGYHSPNVPELAKLKYTRECDPRLLARVSRLLRKSRAQVRMHYRWIFTQMAPTVT